MIPFLEDHNTFNTCHEDITFWLLQILSIVFWFILTVGPCNMHTDCIYYAAETFMRQNAYFGVRGVYHVKHLGKSLLEGIKKLNKKLCH